MPASTEATGARMRFLVHGVPFEITCEAAVMRDALSRRLRAFAVDRIAGADAVAVTITGPGAAPLFAPPLVASGRIVYETTDGEIRYIDANDHVVSDYAGTVQMNLHARGDRLDLAVTGAAPADLMVAAYPMFTLALTEILKRRGRYALHAACPASGGRGLLIAGSSGCGKSTLALAFAAARPCVALRRHRVPERRGHDRVRISRRDRRDRHNRRDVRRASPPAVATQTAGPYETRG